MAEYSLSLNGEDWADNERLVDWQCSKCSVRFSRKEDAMAHIRSEHGSGTCCPHLNVKGAQMAVMAVAVSRSEDPLRLAFLKESGVISRSTFAHAMSEEQALKVVRDHESEILSQMGMKAGFVVPQGVMLKTSEDEANQSSLERTRGLDILLVTVTKVEALAVLELVKENYGREPNPEFTDLQTFYDLGEIHGARTFMVRSEMGSSGPSGSALTVSDAILALSPSAVIAVGIAFGLQPQKQQIGDILVSKQVLQYDLQRIGTGDHDNLVIAQRGDRVSASSRLLDRFRGGELDWNRSDVRFGLILSGSKLVDNVDFRDRLAQIEPEAIGGEMEAAGIYDAAHRRKVDWIVVKAICDWADGKKHENKRERQYQAARNAAEFTMQVMERGGFVSSNPPPTVSRPEVVVESKLTPDEQKLLRFVYDEAMNHPERGYALIDGTVRKRLGFASRRYIRTAEGLIERGFLETVSAGAVDHVVNISYPHLLPTPKGRSFCISDHKSRLIDPEPAQALKADSEEWEGMRAILLENERQYFVYEGKRHYMDMGAADLCDRWPVSVPEKRLNSDEGNVFYQTFPVGDEYNETKMQVILARLYPEQGLVIISAKWGAGDLWDEVAPSLNSRITPEGLLEMQADRSVLGDPIYGEKKTLKVIYTHNGRRGSRTILEDDWLRLP